MTTPSTTSSGHHGGVKVGGRSPALTALAASVSSRSPLLSSRSPPLRANAPEFQPTEFNLSSSSSTSSTVLPAAAAAAPVVAVIATSTPAVDDEPKVSRSSRAPSSGQVHVDVTSLTKALVAQCHYYFSDHNISKDKWMRDELAKEDGWVPISLLCDMPRIRQLTNDPAMLVCALRQSDKLEMNGDSNKTRRTNNAAITGNGGGGLGPSGHNKGRSMDAKRSIYVDRLPSGHNGRTVRELFSRFGKVDHVVALAQAGGEGMILESPAGSMYQLQPGETLRSIFIEFEKQGAAKKAVSQISHFNKMLKANKNTKSTSSTPTPNTNNNQLQQRRVSTESSAPSSPTSVSQSPSPVSSPSASPGPSSPRDSNSNATSPTSIVHDMPSSLISTSSTSTVSTKLTTVTMAPYVESTSSLTIPSTEATASSSASVPSPIQIPLPRATTSAASASSPSPSTPLSPPVTSVGDAKDNSGNSGTKKDNELGDAFVGMKVMSRYAYDKKFGHLSPAIVPMVGGGIPVFGLAGGSPLLMPQMSPLQHIAHLSSSPLPSPLSSPVLSASTLSPTPGTAGGKKAPRAQARDRSNWRMDATASTTSGTDSADNTPTSSPQAAAAAAVRSSSPSLASVSTAANGRRSSRAKSFEESELIAAFMDDGSNRSPSPSGKGRASSPAKGRASPPSSSRSIGAKKAKKSSSRSSGSTDFSNAIHTNHTTTSTNATKKDDAKEEVVSTRRPLQLLQRKEMKAGVGQFRTALGPDPDITIRGFGGRGRGALRSPATVAMILSSPPQHPHHRRLGSGVRIAAT